MDPKEQPQPIHSYPNADRGAEYNKDSLAESRPLVHLTDVMHQPNGTNEHKVSAIHTFKDDVTNETSKEGFSVSKIVLANQKNRNTSNTNISGKKSNVGKFFAIAIVCIIIIAGFSYIGFKTAKTPSQIQAIKNPTQKLAGGMIYSEMSYELDIKDKTATQVRIEIAKNEQKPPIQSGKIKSFIFVYKDGENSVGINASDFLNLVAPGSPDILKRNLKKDFVFGYYSYDTAQPFIILKSENYDSTFAGMLEWERGMYADLGDLIFKKDSILKNTETIATSTAPATSSTTATSTTKKNPTNTTPLTFGVEKKKITLTEFEIPFTDKVIKNNDARVLYRPNGNIALFYTFFNKDTIIITVSEQVLSEIIYRLTSGQITR